MFTRKAAVLFPLVLLLVLGLGLPLRAADTEGGPPVRIAILPFAMHTPAELNYLQSGVREMLASRLAWQGKVQVMDKMATEAAAKGVKDISESEAVRIGSGLKADYVLFGSITGMGQAVSIDAKMLSVAGKGEPIPFYVQTKNLDDVVPQVNNFAQNINQKVFGKPGDKTQVAASEAEAAAVRNPEFLLSGITQSGDKISYLNPNFVEVTPEGSLRQSGVWTSQNFSGSFVGMDIGDFDGEGKQEIVVIEPRKLTVFRKEQQGLRIIGTFEGTPVDHFIWVCAADPMREGHSHIYLTNLRYKGTSLAQVDKAQDVGNVSEDLSSYVLSVSGGKVKVVADAVPYYLNTAYLGQRGKVLVGQQKGAKTDGAFKGDVYEMTLRGKSLAPMTALNLPKGCNIFNFAKADINNDHMDEVMMIDSSNSLKILNAAGDQIYKGRELFGATTNTFESKVEDRRYNMVDMVAIPSPMLVTDLNNDGIPEVVLNRNTTTFDRFLPDSMKYYDKGEIVSLSWDNLGLIENWKTREINGQITALRVGDLDGSGKQQLVVSVVLARDLLKVASSKSMIITYDLNVSDKAKAKTEEDARETVPIKSPTEVVPQKTDKTPTTGFSRRRQSE